MKQSRRKGWLVIFNNKFANEKVKLEELIKKSQADCQEWVKRAISAEVSVLKNWKETEVCRLHSIAANGEATLRVLKSGGSSSASALPQLKSQIDSWETFISSIKKQMEEVEAQYEEKIQMVKNGAKNCLTKMQAYDLSSPPSVLGKQSRPPLSDPAVVSCSPASAPPPLPPAAASPGDAVPAGAAAAARAGTAPTHAGSRAAAASDASVRAATSPLEGSYANKVSAAGPSRAPGRAPQNGQPSHSRPGDAAAQPRPPGLPNNKTLPKAFDNIIASLQPIFPNYSSSDFVNFIKEVRMQNGNTLSSLRLEEILRRVTELILDHQNKAPASVGGALKSVSPAALGQNGAQAVAAEQTVPSPPKARPKSAASKNSYPSRPNFQPWGNVGATSRSKWKKSDDLASDDDPCIICHEERGRDSCELECGHRFHRECVGTWLKEHSSTCPICRVHVLLPEDFPELSARNKYV